MSTKTSLYDVDPICSNWEQGQNLRCRPENAADSPTAVFKLTTKKATVGVKGPENAVKKGKFCT